MVSVILLGYHRILTLSERSALLKPFPSHTDLEGVVYRVCSSSFWRKSRGVAYLSRKRKQRDKECAEGKHQPRMSNNSLIARFIKSVRVNANESESQGVVGASTMDV